MSSLGKLTTAIGSAHNENTLALANINFDFSLYRYDAPAEFQALGANISAKRRQEAEGGSQHRTARRLGALFEGLLPPIPAFSKAYGRRVSEISQFQKQNSKVNVNEGPFAKHMGADGTSIWAAATSGPNAIPVLLLGCMLATIWSGSEATSIWVELVERRRREIEETCTGDSSNHWSLLQAAQQEITRSNLADWDASTRAWLQVADEVMQLQQTQLMLIVNNLQLPVSSNMQVYQSVIDTAKIALLSMENLLNGAAQRVQDGAFLLGLSTWHIYPDMIVHGSAIHEIKQNDSLVPMGSIITIGLQGFAEVNKRIYWSLPLAHLRYYGDPVQTFRSTAHDASRLPVDQLVYVALGALFKGWFKTSNATSEGLRWLCAMYDLFDREAHQMDTAREHNSQPLLPEHPSPRKSLKLSGWLKMLLSAAANARRLSKSDRERASKLIALGYRRYCTMLEEPCALMPSLFGLFNPQNLFPILKTAEDRILTLRKLAKRECLAGDDHIIRYKFTDSKNVSHIEYATVQPLPLNVASKGLPTSSPIMEHQEFRHKRWVALEWVDDHDNIAFEGADRRLLELLKLQNNAVCQCVDGCSSTCRCQAFEDGCLHECSCQGKAGRCASSQTPSPTGNVLERRAEDIRAHGDDCVTEYPRLFIDFCRFRIRKRVKPETGFDKLVGLPDYPRAFFYTSSKHNYHQQPHTMRDISDELFDYMRKFYQDMWKPESFRENLIWHLKDGPWFLGDKADMAPVHLDFCFGDPNSAALYRVSNTLPQERAIIESNRVTATDVEQFFQNDAVDASLLLHHLADLGRKQPECMNCIASLKALASIGTVYESLPEATIALNIAAKPLHDWSYISQHLRFRSERLVKQKLAPWNPWVYGLDLASRFSCIASCEFGTHDIDPVALDHVFAMSSRNSIFVAGPLLDDPGNSDTRREIRRVIGNIGRAGIAMMIAPLAPRIRPLKPDNWELIAHAPFDGTPSDSFQNTSLHLSFTQYTMPVGTGTHGGQDTESFLIESLVSVHDREKWVADIDVLGLFNGRLLSEYKRDCSHDSSNAEGNVSPAMITIDNWEEMLDREDVDSVVRAHQNSKARLATAVISATQGHFTTIISGDVCWTCLRKSSSKATTYIQ